MSRFPLRPEPVGRELCGLSKSPDWREVFGGKDGPLELEIGCGAGGFLLGYLAQHPEVRYVAFEWRKKFAREVQHRAEKLGYANLKVIEGDAREEIPRLFAPGSLSVIHLQFPDPWWKRTHFKRAIVQPDFARLLLELTIPGGSFDLRTDVEEKGRQMLAILEQAGWHNPLGPGVPHPYDPAEVPSTRERRYLVTGHPVFRARLRKPT